MPNVEVGEPVHHSDLQHQFTKQEHSCCFSSCYSSTSFICFSENSVNVFWCEREYLSETARVPVLLNLQHFCSLCRIQILTTYSRVHNYATFTHSLSVERASKSSSLYIYPSKHSHTNTPSPPPTPTCTTGINKQLSRWQAMSHSECGTRLSGSQPTNLG